MILLYSTLSCCVQGKVTERRAGRGRRKGSHDYESNHREHRAPQVHRAETHKSTETKSAYKTTEFFVYVLAVLGVLIASMIVDASFGADPAWRYVT